MIDHGPTVYHYDVACTRYFYCVEMPESIDDYFAVENQACAPSGTKPITVKP